MFQDRMGINSQQEGIKLAVETNDDWVRSFQRTKWEDDQDDDNLSLASIKEDDSSLIHENQCRLVKLFDDSFDNDDSTAALTWDGEEQDYGDDLNYFNELGNKKVWNDVVPNDFHQQEQTSAGITQSTSASNLLSDDMSVKSLNDAFEQLNKCMERTSRSRELVRSAGLFKPATAALENQRLHQSSSPSLQMENDGFNLSYKECGTLYGNDNNLTRTTRTERSESFHGVHSRIRREEMLNISTSCSAGSLSSLGSCPSFRNGVSPRRTRKPVRNASFPHGHLPTLPPPSPLPKNVRVAMRTRKFLLKDLRMRAKLQQIQQQQLR